jgi:hypothetical protein
MEQMFKSKECCTRNSLELEENEDTDDMLLFSCSSIRTLVKWPEADLEGGSNEAISKFRQIQKRLLDREKNSDSGLESLIQKHKQ